MKKKIQKKKKIVGAIGTCGSGKKDKDFCKRPIKSDDQMRKFSCEK